MFFYVLGEGNSDIGLDSEHPGPLRDALKRLAASVSDEEFIFEIISRHELSDKAKRMQINRKSMLIRGKKREFSRILEALRFAQALAAKAQETDNSGAVLFHDCDYVSHVNGEDYYKQMVLAVQCGFAMVPSFKNGVPMIPKPRSESWLLCRYQNVPYKDGNYFENVPANDKAPRTGKTLLAEYFHCNINEIYDHVHVAEIDWQRIKAPSFLFFKKRFIHVVQRLTHQSVTVPEEDTLMKEKE